MQDDSLLRTDKEFEQLYNRNVSRVYRICYLHLKNVPDAEDAAQTVFYKYWKAGMVFLNEEQEKAWFVVAAQNQSRDMLRHWWRSHRADPEKFPEPAATEQPEISAVSEILLSLQTKYKTVLYLYYYEGYRVKDISRILNRNESTIRTQLSKGRERLKKHLASVDGKDGTL